MPYSNNNKTHPKPALSEREILRRIHFIEYKRDLAQYDALQTASQQKPSQTSTVKLKSLFANIKAIPRLPLHQRINLQQYRKALRDLDQKIEPPIMPVPVLKITITPPPSQRNGHKRSSTAFSDSCLAANYVPKFKELLKYAGFEDNSPITPAHIQILKLFNGKFFSKQACIWDLNLLKVNRLSFSALDNDVDVVKKTVTCVDGREFKVY